jgi:L-asparaginase/Glu-tRNA(Gln) amidotransferase subunit D
MAVPETSYPESRVLIIGTGGTICMQQGPDGLQPTDNFLENAMAPRPSFNDFSSPGNFGKSLTQLLHILICHRHPPCYP